MRRERVDGAGILRRTRTGTVRRRRGLHRRVMVGVRIAVAVTVAIAVTCSEQRLAFRERGAYRGWRMRRKCASAPSREAIHRTEWYGRCRDLEIRQGERREGGELEAVRLRRRRERALYHKRGRWGTEFKLVVDGDGDKVRRREGVDGEERACSPVGACQHKDVGGTHL